MKTDKELLQLAAKAILFGGKSGFVYTESEYPKGSGLNGALWDYTGHGETARLWNPLESDGDALRLAVDLDMDVCLNPRDKEVNASTFANGGIAVSSEPYGNEKHASTRRAIVRAAAAIGESME